MRRSAPTLLLGLALALATPPALGQAPGPERAPPAGDGLLICYPNGPGSTEAAAPLLGRLGAYLSQRTGSPCRPIYFNQVEPARGWLEREHPRFAILSLGLYLRWEAELQLSVVALAERNHAVEERFHLLVAQASPWQRLEDLRGGESGTLMWSSLLDEPRFVGQVVLGGALRLTGPAPDALHRATPHALRAVRRLGAQLEGQAVDAVLVDDTTWSALADLQSVRSGTVRLIYTSPPLPTAPVVALPGATPAEAARLQAALAGMPDDPDGRALLETLLATGFRPATSDALEAVRRAFASEAQ